jgi:MoaA/NifB/PqqE/SkfB family radical SAM enzyme
VIEDLSISSDLFHYDEKLSRQAKHVQVAAKKLGIPLGVICIASPDDDAKAAKGKLPEGESAIMFRGRAVEKLAGSAPKSEWKQFTECPHEDLTDPGRVHIDPLGFVHLCQGISIGNVLHEPLEDICARYDPLTHPIAGPVLEGGPAKLATRYQVSVESEYADACHLCYETRRKLRPRYPEILAPDQVYGVIG